MSMRARAALFAGSVDQHGASINMQHGGATGDLPTTAEEELTLPTQPPSLGRNAMEYLERAAVARSLLIGDVVYNFTAGPERSKSIDEGTTTGDPSSSSLTPLRIAQYSQVCAPAWTGDFTGCDRPCEAVGGNGNASAAATADVVVNQTSCRQAFPGPARPGRSG